MKKVVWSALLVSCLFFWNCLESGHGPFLWQKTEEQRGREPQPETVHRDMVRHLVALLQAGDETGVIQLLKDGFFNPHVFEDPDTGATILHYAASHGAAQVVRYLLHERKVCLYRDDTKNSPLHWAVLSKNPSLEVIELLVAMQPALAHEGDSTGNTPFSVALRYPKILDVFVRNGVTVKRIDEYGRTPLFSFVSPETTEILCFHGVNPCSVDHQGCSALHAYVSYWETHRERRIDLEEGIKILLRYGAQIPIGYHPGFSLVPLEEEQLQNNRIQRQKLLASLLAASLGRVEEGLSYIKRRASCGHRPLLPGVVFDWCTNALPFFQARHAEMEEFIRRQAKWRGETSVKPCGLADIETLLSRLATRPHKTPKKPSPALLCMTYDLLVHAADYKQAPGLSEEERAERGKVVLERLFPLHYPDDHSAQKGSKKAPDRSEIGTIEEPAGSDGCDSQNPKERHPFPA